MGLQKFFNSGKYFLNSSEFILESTSKPLLIYNIFVIALICYSLVKKDYYSAGKNTICLVLGSIFIWLLVYLGFEPVAWVLLTLPVYFVFAILALLVLTQIIKTDVNYSNSEYIYTGLNFSKLFGIENPDNEIQVHDYTLGFWPPEHPEPPSSCNRPPHVKRCNEHVPTPPPMEPKERIIGMIAAVVPTCETCDVGHDEEKLEE